LKEAIKESIADCSTGVGFSGEGLGLLFTGMMIVYSV